MKGKAGSISREKKERAGQDRKEMRSCLLSPSPYLFRGSSSNSMILLYSWEETNSLSKKLVHATNNPHEKYYSNTIALWSVVSLLAIWLPPLHPFLFLSREITNLRTHYLFSISSCFFRSRVFSSLLSSGHAFVLVYSITDKESFEEVCRLRELVLEVKRESSRSNSRVTSRRGSGVLESQNLKQSAILNKTTISSSDHIDVNGVDGDTETDRDGVKRFDPPPIVIVANKSDLDSERQVSKEIVECECIDWDVGFVECSAKDNENVVNIFHQLLLQAHLKGIIGGGKEKGEQQTTNTSSQSHQVNYHYPHQHQPVASTASSMSTPSGSGGFLDANYRRERRRSSLPVNELFHHTVSKLSGGHHHQHHPPSRSATTTSPTGGASGGGGRKRSSCAVSWFRDFVISYEWAEPEERQVQDTSKTQWKRMHIYKYHRRRDKRRIISPTSSPSTIFSSTWNRKPSSQESCFIWHSSSS